jgi:hypothetical protein
MEMLDQEVRDFTARSLKPNWSTRSNSSISPKKKARSLSLASGFVRLPALSGNKTAAGRAEQPV